MRGGLQHKILTGFFTLLAALAATVILFEPLPLKQYYHALTAQEKEESPLPSPLPASPGQAQVSEECRPRRYNLQWWVQEGRETVFLPSKNYNSLSFCDPLRYPGVEGVLSFRGNNYRDSASWGIAEVSQGRLEKVWSVRIGRTDTWTGVGWTGQPAVVKWDEKTRKNMDLYPVKKEKTGLKEVIFGALDSHIYFLDLDTGEWTRPPVKTAGPIKGSVSVDPRGFPLLYVGQGIDTVEGRPVPIGYSIYSLLDRRRLYFINGLDKFALKWWGGFDSNALVHAAADTLLEAGENGLIYLVKLNTSYNPAKKQIALDPRVTRYRYKSSLSRKLGVENSLAVYKNLAYFADNDGLLQCLDLNTLSPVWVRDVADDTDSTIVLEEGGGGVFLYTGCEVDNQGRDGLAYARKINALTGELVWERSYRCLYEEINGGIIGTPLAGKNDLRDLVVFNLAKYGRGRGGKLIALNKSDGSTLWELDFAGYSWSSPAAVYSPDGKGYIIFGDSGGNMYLIDGLKGQVIHKITLEGNIEGSPAVYDNMVVVGTRGCLIYGLRIS